ncbi:MAG TPA: type III pantothenate kinase [candidate division Zixibacteria bacterium]|nr:type III pantothenate kinase [candidate division Zixibacteria bacterium]
MTIAALDIGNYRAKLALVSKDGEIISRSHFFTGDLLENDQPVLDRLRDMKANGCVVGCVVPELEDELAKTLSSWKPLFVSGNTKNELIVEYDPLESLGADRLAGAVGAYREYGKILNRGIMLVDSGTTVTTDLISSKGAFLGGAIYPGDEMAMNSLAQYTKRLPKMPFKRTRTVLGSSTRECMLIGVQATIIGAIENLYHRYGRIHGENPFIVLTGASASWIASNLDIPNMVDPDLVLLGLSAIWSYNRE